MAVNLAGCFAFGLIWAWAEDRLALRGERWVVGLAGHGEASLTGRANFGADLPAPTLIVIAMSEWVVAWWWAAFLIVIGIIVTFGILLRRSAGFRYGFDRVMLKLPVIGGILEKATIARWTRTLQTMFAAGVPLVESLDAVGGASGNAVYVAATKKIQTEVSTGTSLTNAMANTGLFPTMVLQMIQIGEESGSLDNMLGKIADFFEREVDDTEEIVESFRDFLEGVSPDDFRTAEVTAGLGAPFALIHRTGVRINPFNRSFHYSRYLGVNYMLVLRKDEA